MWSSRGACQRWSSCSLGARLPGRKWVTGSGDVTQSVLEQRADFCTVQSQSALDKDIKLAEARRKDKFEELATTTNLSTKKLVGGTDAARPHLSNQYVLVSGACQRPTAGQTRRASARFL